MGTESALGSNTERAVLPCRCHLLENLHFLIGTQYALLSCVSPANLSFAVKMPPDFQTVSNAAPAPPVATSDFLKLIEALIGREVASIPATQVQGQENSVVSTEKKGNAKADGQKYPEEEKDPKDQSSAGLLAMMTALFPAPPAKPPLTLDPGPALTEDTYTASIPSLQISSEPALPQEVAEKDAEKELSAPSVTAPEIPIPVSVAPVTPTVPDRSRAKMEIRLDVSHSVNLPESLGKIRTDARQPVQPIAFTADVSEHETKPSQLAPALKTSSQTELQAPLPQQPGVEIARTNPKSEPSQPSVEAENNKTKPISPEPEPEIARTNSKPAVVFAAPTRETGPAISGTASTRVPPASESKAPAAIEHTELQAKPLIRTDVAREISIRIPSADSGNLDVHLVERNGRVQVTVRTADTQLSSALRGELTELVRTLDQKGYKTETWTPADTYPFGKSDIREVQTPARSDSSPDWSGGQPGGGHPGDSQQQKQQKQNRPDWLIELERRLQKEE